MPFSSPAFSCARPWLVSWALCTAVLAGCASSPPVEPPKPAVRTAATPDGIPAPTLIHLANGLENCRVTVKVGKAPSVTLLQKGDYLSAELWPGETSIHVTTVDTAILSTGCREFSNRQLDLHVTFNKDHLYFEQWGGFSNTERPDLNQAPAIARRKAFLPVSVTVGAQSLFGGSFYGPPPVHASHRTRGRLTTKQGVFVGAVDIQGPAHGQLAFANGDVYEGPFAGGQPHGLGTLIRKDGSSFHGEFDQGKRTGAGVCSATGASPGHCEFDQNKPATRTLEQAARDRDAKQRATEIAQAQKPFDEQISQAERTRAAAAQRKRNAEDDIHERYASMKKRCSCFVDSSMKPHQMLCIDVYTPSDTPELKARYRREQQREKQLCHEWARNIGDKSVEQMVKAALDFADTQHREAMAQIQRAQAEREKATEALIARQDAEKEARLAQARQREQAERDARFQKRKDQCMRPDRHPLSCDCAEFFPPRPKQPGSVCPQ